MTQAKGIVPRNNDDAMRSPHAEGYFVYVSLEPGLSRDQAIELLTRSKEALDTLVIEHDGQDVADVVVGFAPRFFGSPGAPRFTEPLQVPAGFTAPPPLRGTAVDADLIFYVVATEEARVSTFLEALWTLRPAITSINMDRGYSRTDGTEVFGYKDGLRNLSRNERFKVAFIHEDDQPEEPSGAEGGSYMAFLRILQNPDAFHQLADDATRDAVIGRIKDGTRLDLAPGTNPRTEPDMPANEPPPLTSHVRKVGPRGLHDDVKIFRRGLPFVEVAGGQVRVGLNFVSFQASLNQFDVVFNDWMMNPHFPHGGPGVDRLFDPSLGITSFEKSGLFFVPPHDERFLGATLFDTPRGKGKPKSGQVSVRKKIVDPQATDLRFERGGFTFQLLDSSQAVVAEFVTDSKGHGQSDELPLGIYTLRELPNPNRPEVQSVADQQVNLDAKHVVIQVQNTIAQPGTGYGNR